MYTVDCGHPSPPVDGAVHYTGTGRDSKAVVVCDAGLALFGVALAVCSEGGAWEPNPADQQCIQYSVTGENVPAAWPCMGKQGHYSSKECCLFLFLGPLL